MNLLQEFVNFLLNQKSKPSLITVKNYKADIGQFIHWFEKEYKLAFNPSIITLRIIEQYKKSSNLSSSSIERHLSSLRKFFIFLNHEKVVLQNPLEKKTVSAEARALEDPWMIRNFKSFLHEHKKSNLTIKNYINDIKSFSTWLGEVALVKYAWNVDDKNLLKKINSLVIEEYKQRLIAANFSPLTINRKLSSLRNYVGWAKNQGLISAGPSGHPEFISGSPINKQAPLLPDEMLKSASQRGEQVQDDTEGATYSSFPPTRLMQKSLKGVNSLFDNLFIWPLAQTIETTTYFFWKAKGKKVFKKNVIMSEAKNLRSFGFQPQDDPVISNIKREFYAPLNVSTRYLPTHKRAWHYIRHVRPDWYKKYHSYSFTHYLHFAILIILSCAVGFGIYDRFFVDAQKENTVLGATFSSSPRILSFQGKLTDSSEIPITKETTILLSLYNSENASTAASIWHENDTVKPDSNGAFFTYLGKNSPIPDNAFSQNSRLFLGITVGDGQELLPRQEIATVPFTNNSQTLQGLEPITNTTKVSNVVLALDSSGNLSIAGSRAHTFQAIGGQFVISGNILSLTTVPGSNSSVEIVPDGLGKIDLQKPIQNTSNDNNLSGVSGAVEFDDLVAILATSSAQSAFNINQNSTGALISASTSGVAKFVVENDGTGLFAGDVGINGGNLTSAATTFNLLNSTITTLNIGGASTTINLGVAGGTLNIKSNVSLSRDFSLTSLTSNGGILYTNASGKIIQTSSGSSSDCFVGGTTPSFTPCSNILSQATRVGIGTTTPLLRLDVQDSQNATAAAQIYNTSTNVDADGLIIKLGNASASAVAASNHFLSFETAGIGIVGSIQGNEGTGVTYATNGVADFAEYFKKDKYQTIEYGSVVCLGNNGLVLKCDHDNNKILGVASERPAFLGGENLGDNSIAVGLVGQVEVFATILNGEIKTGDLLTASDIPGVAVKATKAGQIIGKALEDLKIIDESKVVGFYDPDSKEYRSKASFPNIPLKSNIIRVVKIPLLVNVSWHDPGVYLAQNGNITINSTGSSTYSISNSNSETLTSIGRFFEVVAANIRGGFIKASEVITTSLIITSDSIIVNGQNLKDYIANVVKGQAGIISPINTDRLSANIISPLSSPSLIVKLSSPSGSLIVENASGSAVAKIDDQGNASFSGQLSSDTIITNDIATSDLQTENASVSGTLRAGNIIADSITGLEEKISNVYSTNFIDLASYSAQLSYVPDLAAERAQFNQGLMVFGPTSLSDLSIAGSFSIAGTMFITENSIETLGTDLSLQSLRQGGLSIMGGLVYIDTQGNIQIQGDLSVSGKLIVNVLSPLPTSDLIVNNASGSSILSINQAGDVVASGSGTFAKLNFSLVQPVFAVSSTEVIASSSAGITHIAPYRSEITIRNALVTDKSVIYITPVGTPSAQTPFLMRQIPNQSFTVGVQSPTNRPIDFNWLIIN